MPNTLLLSAQSLDKIKIAKQPLSENPPVTEMSIPEFNKLISQNRKLTYNYSESIYSDLPMFSQYKVEGTPLEFPHMDAFVICWINDAVGYGLYTSQDIQEGEPIALYSGELCKPRESNYNLGIMMQFEGAHQILTIDAAKIGGVASFIQAALRPKDYYQLESYPLQTANVKSEYFQSELGVVVAMLVATKFIPANSQLLIDYGFEFWTSMKRRGGIERVFSANNPTETLPACLFTFSEEVSIPLMITMLDHPQAKACYRNNILSLMAQHHHELLDLLPKHTQENLYEFLQSLKKSRFKFKSVLKSHLIRLDADRNAMIECYNNGLSALSKAQTFTASADAKPLVSTNAATSLDLSHFELENRKVFTKMQIAANAEMSKGNVEEGFSQYDKARQGFEKLFQPHCPFLQIGRRQYVIHRTTFNIHLQFAKAYQKLDMPDNALLYFFIAHHMAKHPDIRPALSSSLISEISDSLDECVYAMTQVKPEQSVVFQQSAS